MQITCVISMPCPRGRKLRPLLEGLCESNARDHATYVAQDEKHLRSEAFLAVGRSVFRDSSGCDG